LPDCPGEYSTVPPGDCDLYLQDCDEGFGCDAVIPLGSTDYTTACLPDPGLKAVGEVCAMDDECLAGLRCIFGSCSPVCCQATGAPCGDGVCNVDRAYGSYYARYCSFLDLCTPFEPVATACTDQGTQCMVSDGYAVCIPPSKQPPLEPGDACEFLNECSHMNACINSICAWNCMLTGGDGLDPGLGGCPTAFTCTAYNSNIDNVGYCLADS